MDCRGRVCPAQDDSREGPCNREANRLWRRGKIRRGILAIYSISNPRRIRGDATGDDVASRVKKMTADRGADVAFDAVGINASLKTALSSLRKGGVLTLIGNLKPEVDLALQTVVTGEIRVQGSCASRGDYPACLDMIARGAVNVDALISATAPLADGAQWFDRLYQKEKGLIKVILVP